VATVVLSATAVANLDELITTRSLPATTRKRVRSSLEALAAFPALGPRLVGRWSGFRFILGPWQWFLIVYEYDDPSDQVRIVTIQDSRSARSARTDQ
jgi:plasmid stabilization system protein ParE